MEHTRGVMESACSVHSNFRPPQNVYDRPSVVRPRRSRLLSSRLDVPVPVPVPVPDLLSAGLI